MWLSQRIAVHFASCCSADDLIGTVPQKKFLVNITGSAGDVTSCHSRRETLLQGTLEVIADRDDAGIKIADSQRGKEGLVCTVTDLGFCHIGGSIMLTRSSVLSTAMT